MLPSLAVWQWLTVVLVLTGPGQGRATAGAGEASLLRLAPCGIGAIDEIDLPAQEQGVIVALEARPGLLVEEGTRLGQIDARDAELRKRVADAEYRRAKEQADNDIKVRHSKAVEATAEDNYVTAEAANRKVAGAVKQTEMRQRLLEFKSAALAVEAAQFERSLAQMQMEIKAAELEQAQLGMERRQLLAPLGGVVVEVYKRLGEWVKPGDPVMRIQRMDRLQVDGFVNASEYGPHEVSGRPVRVIVELERGRSENFLGKIVYVEPIVQQDGTYRVRAEVPNRQQENEWILRPGLTAEMQIDLGSQAQSTARKPR